MGARVEIRKAVLADALAFECMRAADAAEVMASGGYEPAAAVIESVRASTEAWTGIINGEVAATFGVVLLPYGHELLPVGAIWMLSTDTVDKYPVAFMRACRRCLFDLTKRYDVLMNFVDARYVQAVEWARRLGFRIYPPVPYGQGGEPFHLVVLGGGHV